MLQSQYEDLFCEENIEYELRSWPSNKQCEFYPGQAGWPQRLESWEIWEVGE